MIVHANLVALRIDGDWRGVLIEGASGAGKSDLTLRALDAGFRLVADDRTLLWISDGRLFGRAPEVLSGLLEVRGVGVTAHNPLPFAEVALAVDCDRAIERMPEPAEITRLGLAIPSLAIAPLEASAVAKLHLALRHLGGRA